MARRRICQQQLEIQRLRAEIAELKKRKQPTPAGLAGFTDITYLFSAPDEGSGAEEKAADEQDVPKEEGQEEKPTVGRFFVSIARMRHSIARTRHGTDNNGQWTKALPALAETRLRCCGRCLLPSVSD